ncbi:hypothetical protein ABZ608_14375 [Streptomyces sp. NPDC013172]|uniref:hypothetical protein n=1 Tax=Streptomyces sp. NPDC013172 TaxID=3155009 RepID=UPI0033C327F9
MGIDVEIAERNPAQSGFVPTPEQGIVERAYGILMLHCRLVRDYEPAGAGLRAPAAQFGVAGDKPCSVSTRIPRSVSRLSFTRVLVLGRDLHVHRLAHLPRPQRRTPP